MRSFPSARAIARTRPRVPAWAHPQWLVTGTVSVVALAGLAVPLAHADDRDNLENQKDQVQGQIEGVRGEISEASRSLAKLTKKLASARSQLTGAREKLAGVQARLAAAQQQAATLATQLEQAQAVLVAAQNDLAAARLRVDGARSASRDALITIATNGDADLALVSSYAGGNDIEDLLLDQTAHDVITSRQQQALTALKAIEAQLEVHRAAVSAARDQVAGAKQAADDNVTTIANLVAEAQDGESRIAELVRTTESTQAQVAAAKAADEAALERLEKREARIKARIIELARRERGEYNGSTSGFLAKPGPGPVTSPFGYRIHPIYGYYGLHNGIDFGTGCGAPLVAGESGTVVSRFYDEVYGNRLYVAIGKVNGSSITLVYNHATSYVVNEGDKVKRGQLVGYSGTTGWSTGCHLHFTVLKDGEAVDPAPYL